MDFLYTAKSLSEKVGQTEKIIVCLNSVHVNQTVWKRYVCIKICKQSTVMTLAMWTLANIDYSLIPGTKAENCCVDAAASAVDSVAHLCHFLSPGIPQIKENVGGHV